MIPVPVWAQGQLIVLAVINQAHTQRHMEFSGEAVTCAQEVNAV